MNQETLERLIIDRAFGELPPDVETLLDAYLANDPAQAACTREISQTLSYAQEAMKPRQPVALPPLKVTPLRTPQKVTRISFRLLQPARMAAAFALGLGLGLVVWHRSAPVQVQPGAFASASPKAESAPSTIWSADRWINLETKGPSPRTPRLSWSSPVKKPQLND